MWTIGGADRLRFPRFPSELGKQGNARLRPHTHRHHSRQNDLTNPLSLQVFVVHDSVNLQKPM
jgi:hypothetical protein